MLPRHARIVGGEVAPVELGQGAGAFDARRPAADDDHVQRPVIDERRILVGRFPLRSTCSLRRRASASVYMGKACSAAPCVPKKLTGRRGRGRGSRSRAAPSRRSALRLRPGRLRSRSPGGRRRWGARGRGRAAGAPPRRSPAGRSRAGRGAAGTCGSRARRRGRRRRSASFSARAAPTPPKPPPRTRTRGPPRFGAGRLVRGCHRDLLKGLGWRRSPTRLHVS